MSPETEEYENFYKTIDREKEYTPWTKATEHSHFNALKSFVSKYDLENKQCLEIGSSKGIFQDLVINYTGVDISENLISYYHKPYKCISSGKKYPFSDGSFDAIWTIAVHEHIPDLEFALHELIRVMKTGGVLFFAPAWQCRPWAAQGYAVRSYADLSLSEKLIKISLPLRDSLLWRSLQIFPKRLLSLLSFSLGYKSEKMRIKKLKPNYEKLWTSDSDACNSIDPYDSILWFESHGLKCLNYPLHIQAFFVRTGHLIFKKI
jgi:SAM-dependent methyltransferase